LLQRWPHLAIDMLRELSLRLRDTERATIKDLQEKNRQLNQAYQDLQAAQAQIIEKERLERELQVAREIQMSILPNKLPVVDGFDFGASILPARAVGGDLYDFVPLNQDNLGIMIGDVSDKGVPAALFMALTSSLLRATASLDLSPMEVLYQINRHLLNMNHAKMFVTALYGILSPESSKFVYARAGHETPVLVTGDGELWTPPRDAGQILGIFPDPTIDVQSITIPPGSTLILYTDGVTDSTNDKGDFFDYKGLATVLRENHHLNAQELCEKLMAEILQYQGSSPQHDDITVVAIKSSGIKD
jgi:sigma-B regulation protein RsbU (phosphoserine phosphatase)